MNKQILENFSWVTENVIAGSSTPYSKEHFEFLKKIGIKVIINLRTQTSYNVSKEILNNFIIHNIPVKDFEPPTIPQIEEFQQLVQKYHKKSYPILVHCFAGCGRTGTFLASYLLYKKLALTVEDAIKALRIDRPCSVETEPQKNVLFEFQRRIQP